jgi:hypothetical protein
MLLRDCDVNTFGGGLASGEVLLHNSLGVVPHTAVVGSQLGLPPVDSPVGWVGDTQRSGMGSQVWGFAAAATWCGLNREQRQEWCIGKLVGRRMPSCDCYRSPLTADMLI